MRNKTFEISYGKRVYFGSYCFEKRTQLVIDDVHTFDDDENRVDIDSINDKEIFDKIYSLVEKDKQDEVIDEEEYKREVKHSIIEERRNER